MPSIHAKLQAVKTRIAAAAQDAGREAGSVLLLAASKSQAAPVIAAAYAAGQRDFGESYVQEALSKQEALRQSNQALNGLQWHFIGPLQANKTRALAEHFDWVHSVERPRIARRLSEQRPKTLPPLQVCVEVNISGEASKSGCLPEEAGMLCAMVANLPRLQLRGLMAIPALATRGAPTQQRESFARLAALWRQIRGDLLNAQFARSAEYAASFDTLSMGMSADLEAAIAEGATIVRVGTAIFGERTAPSQKAV